MELDKKTLEYIVEKMREFYCRECEKTPLPYDFGFFDALHVVEELAKKEGCA